MRVSSCQSQSDRLFIGAHAASSRKPCSSRSAAILTSDHATVCSSVLLPRPVGIRGAGLASRDSFRLSARCWTSSAHPRRCRLHLQLLGLKQHQPCSSRTARQAQTQPAADLASQCLDRGLTIAWGAAHPCLGAGLQRLEAAAADPACKPLLQALHCLRTARVITCQGPQRVQGAVRGAGRQGCHQQDWIPGHAQTGRASAY